MTAQKLTVGVIGAGRMGTPIIGHLVKKGFATTASDVNPAREAAVAALGAGWTQDNAALAAANDVLLVCVGFDEQVRALLAAGGSLRSARPGTIIAILSTIKPETVQELAAAMVAAGNGILVVDSTVCRGGAAADNGTLLSFVGGAPEVVARLTPVLQAYSADVVHTGGIGTAQVAKAANNSILWACLVANHEALALARHYGLDIDVLRKALMMSSAENHALEVWGTQSMAWAEDDMVIVQDMAARAGLSLPQSGLNRELCRSLKPKRYELEKYGR
jgi:3-hydroxyisobutyrate dehydrogenase